MARGRGGWEADAKLCETTVEEVEVKAVSPAWAAVDENTTGGGREQRSRGQGRGRGRGSEQEQERGELAPPEQIDQRFFVHDHVEFHAHLLEQSMCMAQTQSSQAQ